MDLSVRPLRCFVAVAELRSFTRAAEKLHMTQPSLSIQVNQLEKQLGCRLFERTTRQVIVTPSGERLHKFAQRLVECSDRFLNEASTIRGELSNRLRLGSALYLSGLPERATAIEGFMEAFPQVRVTINSHTQREILLDLMAHQLDVALIVGVGLSDEQYESSGRFELTFPLSYRRHVLRRERVGLCVPSDGPLARHEEIPLSALRHQTIAVPSDEHGPAVIGPILEVIQRAQATAVVPPDSTATGVERYGRKNACAAITFGWFGRDDKKTVRRPIEGFRLHTEYALLEYAGEETAAVRHFVSFVASMGKT